MTEQIRKARILCTEIGLQTYGRKPNEMLQTTTEWKLKKAEAMVREISKLLDQAEQVSTSR